MEEKTDSSFADEVVEELLPEGFDWVRIVRTYPWTSLAVATVGGFLLGRRHGPMIVEALSDFAGEHVTRSMHGMLDLGDEDLS